LNITRFQFDEDFSHHQIDEGRDIIAKERKRRTQRANSDDDLLYYRTKVKPKIYANARPELQNIDRNKSITSKLMGVISNKNNNNYTEIELDTERTSIQTPSRYSRSISSQEIL